MFWGRFSSFQFYRRENDIWRRYDVQDDMADMQGSVARAIWHQTFLGSLELKVRRSLYLEEMKPQFSSHSGPSVKREVHPGLWGGATTHHKFGSVKAELCFALNLTLDRSILFYLYTPIPIHSTHTLHTQTHTHTFLHWIILKKIPQYHTIVPTSISYILIFNLNHDFSLFNFPNYTYCTENLRWLAPVWFHLSF